MSNPIVEVEEGQLKGKVSKSLNGIDFFSFKGIPYAKPPIGELRFSAPHPPEPWEGIRDATKPSKFCAQYDRTAKTVNGDEDCLYLNIFTPKLPTASSPLLPVMVNIHGGGFVTGAGTDDLRHGPEYLVEKDVVIVSINYRLGVLGFLCLDRKEASGNMGLKDMVQALQWIQKNISNFNGDYENVTIFGISAGGASVEYLLLSPMAKGLFHKGIAQSGSSLLHWAQNGNVKDLAFKIPEVKGAPIKDDDKLLEYLKGLSIEDLITASMMVLARRDHGGGLNLGFVPTVEKPGDWEPFLDTPTYYLLSRGEFNKVPFMTGFCSREGLLMLDCNPSLLDKLTKDKIFLDHLPFKEESIKNMELETKLKQIYLEGHSDYNDPDAFAIDFFTDADFLGGIYVATSLIAKNNSPVFFYEFTYDGSLNYFKKSHNIDRKGACHADDGGYTIRSEKLTDKLTKTDELVRDRMVKMWSNFAKYGDPTPKTDELITTKWEPIAETGVTCLVIGAELAMKHEIYPQRMNLYKELYEETYSGMK